MEDYQGGSVELLAIRRVDDDRRVAHVRVGPISIKSIWIVGLKTGKPRISWPESGKGYPIVEADEPLKSEIDKMILAAVGDGVGAATSRPRSRRPAGTAERRPPAPDRPFHDDPLDDLFVLGAG